MPKFHDADLRAQFKDLNKQIDALENEIEKAPEGTDTTAQEDQLEQLHEQRDNVTNQMRQTFRTNRDDWRKSRQSDASAQGSGKAK